MKNDIRGRAPPVSMQWTSLLPQILKAYNKTVHSATGKTPTDAAKPSHAIDVKSSMELKAKSGRRYPEIIVGDRVKVSRKKVLGDKEFVGNFRGGTHTVLSISEFQGQKFYKLNDRQNREYIRADITKF